MPQEREEMAVLTRLRLSSLPKTQAQSKGDGDFSAPVSATRSGQRKSPYLSDGQASPLLYVCCIQLIWRFFPATL